MRPIDPRQVHRRMAVDISCESCTEPEFYVRLSHTDALLYWLFFCRYFITRASWSQIKEEGDLSGRRGAFTWLRHRPTRALHTKLHDGEFNSIGKSWFGHLDGPSDLLHAVPWMLTLYACHYPITPSYPPSSSPHSVERTGSS